MNASNCSTCQWYLASKIIFWHMFLHTLTYVFTFLLIPAHFYTVISFLGDGYLTDVALCVCLYSVPIVIDFRGCADHTRPISTAHNSYGHVSNTCQVYLMAASCWYGCVYHCSCLAVRNFSELSEQIKFNKLDAAIKQKKHLGPSLFGSAYFNCGKLWIFQRFVYYLSKSAHLMSWTNTAKTAKFNFGRLHFKQIHTRELGENC